MNTNSEPYPPRTELTEKLAEKEYRDAFVESRIRRGVPAQIRAIRETLGWSQEKLAELSGIAAPNISRAENTRDTFLTFPTLLKITAALDMALIVKIAPFSELEEWATRPLPDMVPADFSSEMKEREEYEAKTRAEAPAGDLATLEGFLRKTLARQSFGEPNDWTVFSEKKYTYPEHSSVGGLDGITRSSQGNQSSPRPGRFDEPKAKSA